MPGCAAQLLRLAGQPKFEQSAHSAVEVAILRVGQRYRFEITRLAVLAELMRRHIHHLNRRDHPGDNQPANQAGAQANQNGNRRSPAPPPLIAARAA